MFKKELKKNEFTIEDSREELLETPMVNGGLLNLSRRQSLLVPKDKTFEKIKMKIGNILQKLPGTEKEDQQKGRQSSSEGSREIRKILKDIKQPKFGIQLADGVDVNFVQKYYDENVLILGVNNIKVFAFKYDTDTSGIPIRYTLMDSSFLDMRKGMEYQARSKLDNGVIFCSNEEILMIYFDPVSGTLKRDTLLLLSSMREKLDDSLPKGDEQVETQKSYTHLNDDSLRFGEAKFFYCEESGATMLLFSMFSKYSLNSGGEVVDRKSTIVLTLKLSETRDLGGGEIVKFLQTLGHVINLTMTSYSCKTTKLFYIKDRSINENYMKMFGGDFSTHKRTFREEGFNYEKLIYKDSLPMQQFEFDGNGKHIYAMVDHKVKKINKYNKKRVPIYFEQENSVFDFAVSGDFLYTGDQYNSLTIWDTGKARVINDLPLVVENNKGNFRTLDGIIEDETIASNLEEEEGRPEIVDIIINDDFSELIVIMDDKLLFWQIPQMMVEMKIAEDLSSYSSVCFLEDGLSFHLNCTNQVIKKMRTDSLKILHQVNLPLNVYNTKMTSNGEIFLARIDSERENIKQADLAHTNLPTKILRIYGDLLDQVEEVFSTNSFVSSMDIVYQHYLSDHYDKSDLPELAILAVLEETDMVVISRMDDSHYRAKKVPRLKFTDPEFLKSKRMISVANSVRKMEKLTSQNIFETVEGSLGLPGQNLLGLEDVEKRDLVGPSERDFANMMNTGGKFRYFEYFRELNYFVGYMEEIISPKERAIHFIIFNTFKRFKPMLVLGDAFVEEYSHKIEQSSYQIFIEHVSAGIYIIGINSEMGCSLMRFDKKNKSLEKYGEIRAKSNSGVAGEMAGVSKHVYLPFQNKIQIYDFESLKKIYTMETEAKVRRIYKSQDGEFLGVMDSNYMYIIDTAKMVYIQKHTLTNTKQLTKMAVLDMVFFHQFTEYRLPDFNQDVRVVKIIDTSLITGLRYMPVEHLSRCFSEKDIKKSIFYYAEFYCNAIRQTGGYDYIFGPLNPFIFAIYYSEESMLQSLLEKFTYPKKVHGYTTPMEYCFQEKELDCLRILCNIIWDRPHEVHFTKQEFQSLMFSGYEFCENLLAKAPLPLPFERLNFDQDMKYSREIRLKPSLIDFMIENEESQQTAEVDRSGAENESRDRIEIHYVPFTYNFEVGSRESLDFLRYYAESESVEFIRSEWKTVIFTKWSRLKYLYAFNMLIFWLYMFFCIWSLVFNHEMVQKMIPDPDDPTGDELEIFEIVKEKQPWVRYVALGLNVLVALLEVLQMIAYCTYSPAHYFTDFWNYIDVSALVLAFVFFVTLYKGAASDNGSATYIAMILISLICYRGFSYLRFFSSFTSMIGIINTIVSKSVAFFSVLYYAYFIVFFMLVRIDPDTSLYIKIRDTYIFTLFGGLEQDHFESRNIYLPMIIGTMIVTIILLNVLIAFMSNVYNKMEERQSVISLKERASILLDLEVYISIFVKMAQFCKMRKMSKPDKQTFMRKKERCIFFLTKIENLSDRGGPNNAFSKMKNLEKEILGLEEQLTVIGSNNEKHFDTIKKKIKAINKFFGFEQNDLSHFDVKMQDIMLTLFEDFREAISDHIVSELAAPSKEKSIENTPVENMNEARRRFSMIRRPKE